MANPALPALGCAQRWDEGLQEACQPEAVKIIWFKNPKQVVFLKDTGKELQSAFFKKKIKKFQWTLSSIQAGVVAERTRGPSLQQNPTVESKPTSRTGPCQQALPRTNPSIPSPCLDPELSPAKCSLPKTSDCEGP
ncbi:UNVERIFIED_CONTAM: hypothetical protein K2H54_016730 [Gekko kuhli]